MKKFIVLIMIALMSATCFGATYAAFLRDTGIDGTTIGLNSQKQLEALQPGQQVHSGRTYYVDSATGDSASNGESWITAMATIDQAINRAAARVANGTDTGRPLILVHEYHNEALGASGADADLAGLTIRGLGRAGAKPILDYDVATGTFDIGAADVTLINLRFRASITEIVSGIDVQAAGDNFTIIGCEFGYAEASGTDEFDTAISIASGAANALVQSCFFNAEIAGAGEAIYIGVVSGAIIEGNRIFGDYATGCIVNVGAADDIVVERNLLFNGHMHGDGGIGAVAAMSMAEGTGGYIGDNRFVSDVDTALLMRIGDDMVFMNNFITDTDGDEFSGTREAGGPLTLNSVSGHVDG